MNKEIKDAKHHGRIYQTGIYLGKFFRMFVFQSDWKVMPMSAIIAGLVAMVMGPSLFNNMEGHLMGSFAISCICVWNGFFNSIQVVCRERPIVKREHRSGVHISSYITAHTIYQAFLCMLQTIITLFVFYKMNIKFPETGVFFSDIFIDLGVTIFLSIFAADMLSLLVSCLVHNTTTAMTVMPFLLIFQLVFSSGFFSLPESVTWMSNLTITKWSLTATCAQGQYNSLPMVAVWKSIKKMSSATVTTDQIKEFMLSNPELTADPDPDTLMLLATLESLPDDQTIAFSEIINVIEQQPNGVFNFEIKCGELNQEPKYASTRDNVGKCWGCLAINILLYISLATIALEFIDKDKR